jgi:hypothetical protein
MEGRNLQIQLRWSGGDVARIREYTEELICVKRTLPKVAFVPQAY